jgi:hypothetical protein
MKKIYKNPEMKIVKVQSARMIAASEVNYGGKTSSTSGNLSRQSNGWDDDEEY